jgi:hypothetical protein
MAESACQILPKFFRANSSLLPTIHEAIKLVSASSTIYVQILSKPDCPHLSSRTFLSLACKKRKFLAYDPAAKEVPKNLLLMLDARLSGFHHIKT